MASFRKHKFVAVSVSWKTNKTTFGAACVDPRQVQALQTVSSDLTQLLFIEGFRNNLSIWKFLTFDTFFFKLLFFKCAFNINAGRWNFLTEIKFFNLMKFNCTKPSIRNHEQGILWLVLGKKIPSNSNWHFHGYTKILLHMLLQELQEVCISGPQPADIFWGAKLLQLFVLPNN